MKNFMDENFLLQTETAQKLYHEHAAKMPIIDYHCHLIPQMVADDYQFKSLTEIWLGGDHYKWRAMRTNGVDERFCTGKDTTDWEKFEKEQNKEEQKDEQKEEDKAGADKSDSNG